MIKKDNSNIIKNQSMKKREVLFCALTSFIVLLIISIKILNFSSVDEKFVIELIKKFYWDPFPVIRYPSFFLYITYIFSKIAGLLLNHIGFDFVFNILTIDNLILFAGRTLNFMLSVMFIFYFFIFLKKHLRHEISAYYGVILLSTNFTFLLYSRILSTDLLTSIICLIASDLLLTYIEKNKTKYLFLSGYFIGLAISTKYNVALILPMFIITLFTPKGRTADIIRRTWKLGLGIVTGFLSGNPNWIVKPVENILLLLNVYNLKGGSVFQGLKKNSALETLYIIFNTYYKQFGFIFFLLFIISVIIIIKKKNKKIIILFAGFTTYILLLAFTRFYGIRFSLPSIPLYITIIVSGIDEILPVKEKTHRKQILTFITIFFAAFFTLKTIHLIKLFNLTYFNNYQGYSLNFWYKHNLITFNKKTGYTVMSPPINFGYPLEKSLKKGKIKKLRFIIIGNAHYKPNLKMLMYEKFTVFHKIVRKKLKPWTPSTIFFLYKPNIFFIKNKFIIKKKLTSSNCIIPKMIYNPGRIAYLPHGYYEKLPLKLTTRNGFAKRYYYSYENYNNWIVFLFNPENKIKLLKLQINNKHRHVSLKPFSIMKLEFSNVKKKLLFPDFVYTLVTKEEKQGKGTIILAGPRRLLFNNCQTTNQHLSFMATLNSEELFDDYLKNEKVTLWEKKFYYSTGMDYKLLRLMNAIKIKRPVTFILKKGKYLIKLNSIKEEKLKLIIFYNKKNHTIKEEHKLKNTITSVEIKGNIAFGKIVGNNIDAEIIPDYRDL